LIFIQLGKEKSLDHQLLRLQMCVCVEASPILYKQPVALHEALW